MALSLCKGEGLSPSLSVSFSVSHIFSHTLSLILSFSHTLTLSFPLSRMKKQTHQWVTGGEQDNTRSRRVALMHKERESEASQARR